MKLALSVDNVELNNDMVDGDGFEYPVVFTTKKLKTSKMLPGRENAMRYLSQVMSQSNGPDPAVSLVLVVNKSNDSASGKVV